MGYRVKLTDYAIRQMQDIVSYISKVLLVPDVALGWSDKIKNEIADLSYLPSRFPFVEDEP
ncbi:MAG: hypothetical protein LUD07_11310 [Clostridiales bacterium]|nr:hypothetical protein [Clostridiales bacterium]